MKKTTLATLLALVAIAMFAFGCKKEEPANTDTATSTDTAPMSRGPGRRSVRASIAA